MSKKREERRTNLLVVAFIIVLIFVVAFLFVLNRDRYELRGEAFGDGSGGDACYGECSGDSDSDGVCDEIDNCPSVPNPDQNDVCTCNCPPGQICVKDDFGKVIGCEPCSTGVACGGECCSECFYVDGKYKCGFGCMDLSDPSGGTGYPSGWIDGSYVTRCAANAQEGTALCCDADKGCGKVFDGLGIPTGVCDTKCGWSGVYCSWPDRSGCCASDCSGYVNLYTSCYDSLAPS